MEPEGVFFYISDATDLIIRQFSFQIHSVTLLYYRESYRYNFVFRIISYRQSKDLCPYYMR